MPARFNPPPNWPPPPAGWTPPPRWQPDPAWGPPPEGWPLWVDSRANPRAWSWSLGSALVLYLLAVVPLAVFADGFDAEGAGRLLTPFLLAGLGVGLAAWLSRGRWPTVLYPVAVLVVSLVLAAITAAGATSA